MKDRSYTHRSILRLFVLMLLIVTILSGSLNIGEVYQHVQSAKVEQKSKKSCAGDCELPYEEQEKEVEDSRNEDRSEDYLALAYFLKYSELLFQCELNQHECNSISNLSGSIAGVPLYLAKRSLII
jgi:hypothetical protein